MQFSTKTKSALNVVLFIIHEVTTQLALNRTKRNKNTWRLQYPHRVNDKLIWMWRHEQITDEF